MRASAGVRAFHPWTTASVGAYARPCRHVRILAARRVHGSVDRDGWIGRGYGGRAHGSPRAEGKTGTRWVAPTRSLS